MERAMSTTLDRFADALRRFNQIVESDLDLNGKYNAMLTLGMDVLNLDMGIISQISGDTYTVITAVVREGEAPSPGTRFELGQTYCVHTLNAGAPTAFEAAGQSEIATHPCYQTFGLESYIGVPVMLDGRAWGTLNFTSPEPYSRRFSEADYALLETFAQWIGLNLRYERELARTRAGEQEERLRGKLLEVVANAIMMTDPEGRIEWVNTAFTTLTGYTLEEVKGHSPRILSSGKQDEAVYRNLWKTITSGQVWKGELINRRKNGKLYHEEQTITPVTNAAGELTHFIAIKQDVSHRYELERLKHEFISVVSHEIRTPLTSIRGSLGLLQSGALGELPDKARQLVTIASQNSERLVRLVNDILDIEKIESNDMSFDLKLITLRPIITQVLEESRGICTERGIQLRCEGDGLDGSVLGDPDRLHQMLLNLIANAISYSPDQGQVRVTVSRCENQLCIRVQDEGPGVPESFVPHLFEKFAQAEASDTRQHSGSGLGLAIAQAIAERHGGTLRYVPDAGPGACFEACLPEADASNDPLLARVPSLSVLVAATSPELFSALHDQLGGTGWLLSSCAHWPPTTDEREHLATPPDAILVPASLGTEMVLSGIESLRRQDGWSDIPVIVLQADAGPAPTVTHLQFVDVVRTPLNPVELRGALARALCLLDNRPATVLHVEDDPSLSEVIEAILAEFANLQAAHSLAEAKAWLQSHDADLILLDQRLPDGHGLSLMRWLNEQGRTIPVVVLSGYPLPAQGAPALTDYLQKGAIGNGELKARVAELIATRRRAQRP
ncbi:MAG: PAS domain S-box protein [Gammaproteobacteria bacterium]|nr:MAG: PAS domain S-box protein [Gammaproteobacteria bacterium]